MYLFLEEISHYFYTFIRLHKYCLKKNSIALTELFTVVIKTVTYTDK